MVPVHAPPLQEQPAIEVHCELEVTLEQPKEWPDEKRAKRSKKESQRPIKIKAELSD